MEEPSASPPPNFSLLAALFEGGLAILAVFLGWLLNRPPLTSLVLDGGAFLLGLAGAIPPLIILFLCLRVPVRPFSEVLRAVDTLLVPMFKNCSVIEMAVISLLAGIGEEMLFRGVLQFTAADYLARFLAGWDFVWLGGHASEWLAVVAMAVLFGLVHAVNASYALLAGLIGLYLGGLWIAGGNLLVPIVAHGVYDFLALVYLIKIRKSHSPAHIS